MKIEIENENDLDNYILCHYCFTLHYKVPLRKGMEAHCNSCNSLLYGKSRDISSLGLSLSLSGLIFFIVANLFPLVKIDMLGNSQYLTLSKTFISLFDNGFYIVGMLSLFLIFIFPLLILLIHISIFLCLKLKRDEKATEGLLILISHIKPWSMSDVFLVSILVSLVKLIGVAEIEMGASFWAFVWVVLVEFFLVKMVKTSDMWRLKEIAYSKKEYKYGDR